MNNKQPQQPSSDPKDQLYSLQPLQQPKQKEIRERPKQSQQPKKRKKVHLSFQDDQQQEPQLFKMPKNPALTKDSHLLKTDQIRKSSNNEHLEQTLKAEYLEKIQKLKQELIEIEYQFWEGGEMVKNIRRKKKEKVKDLLQVCRLQLISSFKSLAQLTSDDLLLVVKDFIVPHEMTIYEIEALELKTKKNELLMNLRNVKIKKEGKEITLSVNIDAPLRIIEKIQYEKNKQSYPFCNWQTLKITQK